MRTCLSKHLYLLLGSASIFYAAIGAIAGSLFYLTALPGLQAFFQLEHCGVIPRGIDDDFIREMFARGFAAVGWGLIDMRVGCLDSQTTRIGFRTFTR
jgi:hypothetical protein